MNHDNLLLTVLECGGIPNGTYYLIDDDCLNKLLQKYSSYELKPIQNSELWDMWVKTSNHVQYAREIERQHGIE